MGTSTVTESGTAVEFDASQLQINAEIYRTHKRIVDACSGYDNVEDAKAGLDEAWKALEAQVENGGGFTPSADLGFGSDNAAVIAESLMGLRNTVGTTRKQFAAMGKK